MVSQANWLAWYKRDDVIKYKYHTNIGIELNWLNEWIDGSKARIILHQIIRTSYPTQKYYINIPLSFNSLLEKELIALKGIKLDILNRYKNNIWINRVYKLLIIRYNYQDS